jgi:hypothetical protein
MAIEIRDFTGGELEGAGLFDELMRTVNSHLKNEYSTGRIVGDDYASVYLGSITNAMQVAAQFVLSQDKTNKEIELMQQQILQAQKQNELIDLQKDQLTISNATAQYNLDFILPKELEKLTSEIAHSAQQIILIQEQITTQEKQQQQMDAQILLTAKQEDLVDEQIIAATYQYVTPDAGMLYAQYTKIMGEVDVLAQKKITELAQTVGTEATVGGLVGKEIALKKTQSDSFIRDSEQKAAKIYADAFQIMFSVNPDGATYATPEWWGINAADSSTVFSNLLSGITNP